MFSGKIYLIIQAALLSIFKIRKSPQLTSGASSPAVWPLTHIATSSLRMPSLLRGVPLACVLSAEPDLRAPDSN